MRIIVFILALVLGLALPAVAQRSYGPSFTVPPGGGSGSGSGGGVSAAGSNVLNNLTVVTNCYTTARGDTNGIVISGGGLAAVNTSYRHAGATTVDGQGIFTNGAGTYVIRYSSAYGGHVISNVGGTVKYGTFATAPFSPFDDDLGGGGALPSGVYADMTNCFTAVAAASGSTFSVGPDSTNYYVNSFIGNDTNAVAGDPYHPWRTVHGALLVLPRNSTVYITSAGNHALGTDGATIILTNGCRLIGLGAGVTSVGTALGAVDSLYLCADTIVANLTWQGQIVVGDGQTFSSGASIGESTNVVLRGVQAFGAADGLGLDTWRSFRAYNCEFYSTYDALANWDNRGLDKTAYFSDCHFTSIKTNTAFETMHGVSWMGGTFIMDGGSITVSNGQTHNAALYVPASTNAASKFFLNGVRLALGTTNGAVSQVCWFSNASQALITGTHPIEAGGSHDVPLVNSMITNRVHDHIVGVTNANSTHTGGRTNNLIDTTVFGTNGFLKGKYRVNIYDKTGTASGTNIWLVTAGNQKINGGPTQTNIAANFGAVDLEVGGVGGTNWVIKASYP